MKTQRAKIYKKSLARLVDSYPEFKKVKNRYKLMRCVLQDYYPIITGSVSKDTLELFLREAVYIDRQIRHVTEDEDGETKEILSQEFVLEEGYELSYPHPSR